MELLEKLNIANRQLRKVFGKEVKILGRSKCCGTCTTAEIHNAGFENYIAWKIFNSGMNKNLEYITSDRCDAIYANWNLTDEQLDKAVEVLKEYFEIEKPRSEAECLMLKLR